MILYKFMSLTPFERVADALLARRLYCPKPDELNDPLEGMLGDHAEGAEAGKPFDDQLRAGMRNLIETDRDLARARVCCFSRSPDSMQMWSYYAGGHRGLCLEVDVSEYASKVRPVEYVGDTDALREHSPVDRLAFKHETWRHEHESRLIRIDEPDRPWIRVGINSVLVSAGLDPDFIVPVYELCRRLGLSTELATFSTQGQFTRLPFGLSEPPFKHLKDVAGRIPAQLDDAADEASPRS